MLIQLPDEIQRDMDLAIRSKIGTALVVNAYETAAEIRRKHALVDVTLEDIAASIARLAVQRGCAVEIGKAKSESAEACN